MGERFSYAPQPLSANSHVWRRETLGGLNRRQRRERSGGSEQKATKRSKGPLLRFLRCLLYILGFARGSRHREPRVSSRIGVLSLRF